MQTAQVLLKQFGASVIEFAGRFRRDLFWKTEFVIVGILFFLCLTNLIIVAISSHYLHLEVASVVLESVTAALTDDGVDGVSAMGSQLRDVRNVHLFVTGSLSIVATILFGYIVARIALAPTRNALTAQKQFIANLAHELRTPLSIVKANTEIMLLESTHNPEITSLSQSNIEELDRISGIINNLLTLNTFRHKEHLELSSIDLTSLLRHSTRPFERLIESGELKVFKDIENELYAWGNRSALDQIVMNLVKNAIIYTPPGGSIRISARTVSRALIEIEVKDSGIGIAEEKLHRIFEPFYQVDPSRSGQRGSSGLGLAIVSELIKLHHGKILVSSTPGVGTTVQVQLPTRPIRPTTARTRAREVDPHRVMLDFSKKP